MPSDNTLKNKTLSGIIWNFAGTFGTQLLQLLPTFILARLLDPSDYGIVAIALVFTSFLSMFAYVGLPMALIQKKELNHIDICSVFYFNIFSSFFIYILLFITAPYCASFFDMPDVRNVIRISSISLILGSIGLVPGSLFKREIDYKTLTKRNLFSRFIAAIVAITVAFLNYGYWALVWQEIVASFISCVANWTISKWRPTLSFSFKNLIEILRYGYKMLLKSLTDYGFDKAYDVTIGKCYSASDLSYFNRAFSTVGLFINTFLDVLNNVAFASFSKMQSDFTRLKNNVIRFLLIECMMIFFIMALIGALATPFFHLMYSHKWDAAIPLFRLLCVWGLFRPISCVFANGLMAQGHPGVCLRVSLICRIINVLLLFVTWKYGLSIMIIGQIVAFFTEAILYTIEFNKKFSYSIINLLSDITPYLFYSLIIFTIIFFIDNYVMDRINLFTNINILTSSIRLLIGIIIGISLFLSIYKKASNSVFKDFKDIIIDATKQSPMMQNFIKLIM